MNYSDNVRPTCRFKDTGTAFEASGYAGCQYCFAIVAALREFWPAVPLSNISLYMTFGRNGLILIALKRAVSPKDPSPAIMSLELYAPEGLLVPAFCVLSARVRA